MSIAIPSLRGAISVPSWTKNSLWRTARAKPSLDLRFADTKSLVDSATGQSLVTFARASGGTYVGSDGVLRTAATNEPRFDHGPITGESLGLLVEEQRTNLVLGSADFSATYTSLGNITVSSDATTAPDGSLTADSVAGTNSTVNVKYWYKSIASSATGIYTASVYLKANSQSIVLVRLNDNTGNNGARQLVNLSTGTLSGGVVTDGTATGASSSISSAGNGWYRCTVTCTLNSAFISLQGPSVYFDGYTTSTSTNSYFVWGAQLEAGVFPTSYIPTPLVFTSRASTATYFNASGVLQTAAVNEARSNAYLPDSSGVFRPAGLLVEEARTNLTLNSATFQPNSGITPALYTIAQIAPDGTTTGSRQATATPRTFIDYTGIANATYTFSFYYKVVSGSSAFSVQLKNAFSDTVITSDTSGVATTAWKRFSITGTTNGTTAGARIEIVGSVPGFVFWGAQLEAGSFPTSYIPTTSAAVTRAADVSTSAAATRAADVAAITGTNFSSSWYNLAQGSIYHQGRSSSAANFFSIDDTTVNNRITSYMPSATTPNFFVQVSGAGTCDVTSSTVAAGSVFAQANAYQTDNFAIVTNGGAISTDLGGGVPSVSRLLLGANTFNTAVINGHLRRFTYWPQRLQNSTLQTITQP